MQRRSAAAGSEHAGAHGFSALAHLRGLRPDLPVIVISAMDDAHTVRQAMAFGAQGFVSKSGSAEAIGAGVRAVLNGEIVTPPHLAMALSTMPTPVHWRLPVAWRS